ncbi:hypothetical protein D3C78_1538020 [compost metagenome]
MLEQFLGFPGTTAGAQVEHQLRGIQGRAEQQGPKQKKRSQVIAIRLWSCRQGWHTHTEPESEHFGFFRKVPQIILPDYPMTLVRFGKMRSSVVANRMSPA